MTRLIDADSVEKVLTDLYIKRPLDSDRWVIGAIESGIRKLPTIDAIPVDWIEGWTAATNSRELFLAMLYDWRRHIDPPSYVEPGNNPAALKQHNNSAND
jgi:hypothetical protein